MTQDEANETTVIEADLLVIGAGMAGMTASAYAAKHGAIVIVVEKGPEIGGSAVLSGGGLWTAADVETLRRVNPEGDPELGRVLVEHYNDIANWVESTGVDIADRVSMEDVQGFPSYARVFDVLGYVNRCRNIVIEAGGFVVTSANVESLLGEDGRVVGAVVRDRDGVAEIRSPYTVLSSGGFQNNAEFRRKYIGEQAFDLLVRSNPNSAGEGIRLGKSMGASTSKHMDGWYGHTVPYPLSHFETTDYLRYAQFGLSPRSILLDHSGKRFVDESIGYYVNAQMVSRLPEKRALLVFDENVRLQDFGGRIGEQIDRPREAARDGARVAEAKSLEELDELVRSWGYENVVSAVKAYNACVTDNADTLDPPRKRNRRPFDEPPYFAMDVQPAITFTMGGLRINGKAQVLNEEGKPIPGLLSAGVDAGGIYYMAYGGGLSYSGVFGMQAAQVALAGLGKDLSSAASA